MTSAHDRLCPPHLRTRGTCSACALITAVRAAEAESWQQVVETVLDERDAARRELKVEVELRTGRVTSYPDATAFLASLTVDDAGC